MLLLFLSFLAFHAAAFAPDFCLSYPDLRVRVISETGEVLLLHRTVVVFYLFRSWISLGIAPSLPSRLFSTFPRVSP